MLPPYATNTQQIFSDLNRGRFLPTKDKTLDNYITDWTNPADFTYTQGNMSGAYFSNLLMNSFIQQSPNFVNAEKGREDTSESRNENYFHRDNKGSVNFGYYDDKGVLCGVSISYSKLDPSIWTATVIRNTTAKAEDREVMILTPDEMHELADGFTEGVGTSATFFDFIGSAEVQQLLTGTLLDNGEVNVQRLDEVRQDLSDHYLIRPENKTYATKQAEINAFCKKQQDATQVVNDEFAQAKTAIEEDQNPDKEIRIQELTKIRDIRINLINEATKEQEITAAKIASPRSGLELLEDTLRSNTGNTKALGRVLLAVKSGTLMVNGQTPDEAYPIGEYLTHGGRVIFDVSELAPAEQQEFYAFITNNQATPRAFATHRAGGTDANGSPAEAKSGLLGAVTDAFRALFGVSKHAGINLPIGGNHLASREGTLDSLGKKPDESGEWGHMYLHHDSNMVMVGIEPSAPGKNNMRTGESHSKTGSAGELSPFLEKKIDSRELHREQIESGKTPLSTKEKYNWASVKISPEQFRQMKTADKGADYVALVKATPANAEPAEPNRKEKMEAWAKATKEGNKTSMAAKIFGFVLFTVGIVLAFAPIPGVAQVVGGWLASVGLGVAAGTVTLGVGATAAAVGLGVFALGTRQDPAKPQALYEKNLSKLPPVEVVQAKPPVDENQVVVGEQLQEGPVDVVQPPILPVVENLAQVVVEESLDLSDFNQQGSVLSEIVEESPHLVKTKHLIDSVHAIQPTTKQPSVGMDKGLQDVNLDADNQSSIEHKV